MSKVSELLKKSKEQRATLSVKIPVSLRERLSEAARARGVGKGAIVEAALVAALEELESEG